MNLISPRLPAGDTLALRVELADYPAGDGWVLHARFVPRAGGAVIALTGTADGDVHLLDAAASVTATWAAGDYATALWVEQGVESFVVEQGQIAIAANPRTMLAATDTRSQAEIALAACKAAFAAWTPTQRRYRIGEREMEFASTAEILRAISYWEAQVAREQGTTAPGQGGRYYIRAR